MFHVEQEARMFIALELSLEIVGELKDVRARVAQFDRGLEDEMRRAARSVALNVSEGSQRAGRDRPHAYRLAAGSAAELQTAMRIAIPRVTSATANRSWRRSIARSGSSGG